MTSPTDDRDLEAYLAGESEISRRYQAMSREEPTRTLDRAVLIEARTAGEAPATVTPFRPRRARWMVPFAAAATVLLSFAIFRDAGMNSHAPAQDQVLSRTEQETVMPITTLDLPEPQYVIVAPASPEASVAAQADKRAADSAGTPAPAAAANDLDSAAETNERLRQFAETPFPPPAPKLEAPASVSEAIVAQPMEADFRKARIAAPPSAAEEALAKIRRQLDAGNKDEARAAFKEFRRLNPDYFKQHPETVKAFPEFADLLK